MTVLHYRIGIDLGGTKIAAILLSPSGETIAETRRPTPRGDYDATIDSVAEIAMDLEAQANASATIGIGVPGSISPSTGALQNANSTWLNGRAFREDLSARLGREVRLANDANCFALSEATDGAAAGARSVFGVIIGTGTGGGLVHRGSIVDGPNAIGGEWGHNPLPWPAATSGQVLPAGAAAAGAWRPGSQDRRSAAITGTSRQALTAEEIAERAESGDKACRETSRPPPRPTGAGPGSRRQYLRPGGDRAWWRSLEPDPPL